MKTQKKLQRRRVARRAAPLTLMQRVERMERELLFPKLHATTAAALATAVEYAKIPRFSKLGFQTGSAIKHAAVRHTLTDIAREGALSVARQARVDMAYGVQRNDETGDLEPAWCPLSAASWFSDLIHIEGRISVQPGLIVDETGGAL